MFKMVFVVETIIIYVIVCLFVFSREDLDITVNKNTAPFSTPQTWLYSLMA